MLCLVLAVDVDPATMHVPPAPIGLLLQVLLLIILAGVHREYKSSLLLSAISYLVYAELNSVLPYLILYM
jgi:hypothetical protein